MYGFKLCILLELLIPGFLNEWLIFFVCEGPSDLRRHICAYDGERVNYVPLLVNLIVV